MDKRIAVLIGVLLLTCTVCSFADDECDLSLKDAKALYNAGKYKEARDLFVYVQKICSPTYGSANTWVQKCDQAIKGNPSKSASSRQQSAPTTLSADKTRTSFLEGGGTDNISVTANKNWKIISVPASWCQASASTSGILLTASPNPDNYSRSTYIQIATVDGKKNLIIYIDQAEKRQTEAPSESSTSTSTSSYSSSSYNYRSSYSGYTALSDFNDAHGKWEVDWFSARMGICTGFANDYSLLAFRYSVLKVEPVVLGIKYDFIGSYGSFYYQPDIKLVFPWSSDWAAEFGIGPSVQVDLKYGRTAAWFTTELGILYHWGDVCSSDFFMRYDGIFSIGASINFSTGF